jgi:hypothetical protein
MGRSAIGLTIDRMALKLAGCSVKAPEIHVKPAVYKIRNAANVLNWEPEASGLLCSVTSLAHLLSKC